MKIKILRGLPASGKTSFARKFIKENPNWVRINRDDLRNMRGEYWVPKQEDLITSWEYSCIGSALLAGNPVILDSTNLNAKYLKALLVLLKSIGKVNIEYQDFTDVSIKECIERDLERMCRSEVVGEDVIIKMAKRHLPEKYKEEFKYMSNTDKPKAVIFDIDGTLARMDGRSPYDYTKVSTDKPIVAVWAALHNYIEAGYKIIYLSGRSEVCREETTKWIARFQGHALGSILDMRTEKEHKDGVCDTIVKKRLFDKYKDDYNIEAVFDDRDKVVKMWRELGLQCFQCNYGSF